MPLLLCALLPSTVVAKDAVDYAGNWVLRLGNRPLVVVTLNLARGSSDSLVGVLIRPKFSYQVGNESFFYAIKGQPVSYPIIRSKITGDCLTFTAKNPSDETDEDDYRLCPVKEGRGTLGYDFPGVEPWPVDIEKEVPPVATDWESRAYFLDDTDVPNSDMNKFWEEDKKDRQLPYEKIDWSVVTKSDAARREATLKLLAEGKFRSGIDFERASLIFQHSDIPDDYLLAHTLALVALARGRASAAWMAAATLDRYLQSIHQPQIYGTQTDIEHRPATQEPYNRRLISDSLRRMLDVPSQAAQEEQRKQYESGQSQH